jgi:hypothetical protein
MLSISFVFQSILIISHIPIVNMPSNRVKVIKSLMPTPITNKMTLNIWKQGRLTERKGSVHLASLYLSSNL